MMKINCSTCVIALRLKLHRDSGAPWATDRLWCEVWQREVDPDDKCDQWKERAK